MTQIEDTTGITHVPDIQKNVPGIGADLIGDVDLSQELGYPRHYENEALLDAMAQFVEVCKKHKVPVGYPHVEAVNAERIIK